MSLSALVSNLCKRFHSRREEDHSKETNSNNHESIYEIKQIQMETDTFYFGLPGFIIDDYLYNLSHSYGLAYYFIQRTSRHVHQNAEMYVITNDEKPIHYLVKFQDLLFKSHDRYIDILGLYDSEDVFMNKRNQSLVYKIDDSPDRLQEDSVQLYKNFKMRKVTEYSQKDENEIKLLENQHKFYANIIGGKVSEFITRKHGNLREA